MLRETRPSMLHLLRTLYEHAEFLSRQSQVCSQFHADNVTIVTIRDTLPTLLSQYTCKRFAFLFSFVKLLLKHERKKLPNITLAIVIYTCYNELYSI